MPVDKAQRQARLGASSAKAERINQQLIDASKTGRIDRMAQALESGADPNYFNKYRRTALHVAAIRCKPNLNNIIQLLLSAGADIDARQVDQQAYERGYSAPLFTAKDLTPLISATLKGCSSGVAGLLANGANPRISDRDGFTALHYIAAKWTPESTDRVIDRLLQAGADIDARDIEGRTPLMMTMYNCSEPDALELDAPFLSRGADVDATDNEGNSFLHRLIALSACRDPAETVSRLIDQGAAVNIRNHAGKTPLALALESGNQRVIDELVVSGGIE